jgi:hypothetical protein
MILTMNSYQVKLRNCIAMLFPLSCTLSKQRVRMSLPYSLPNPNLERILLRAFLTRTCASTKNVKKSFACKLRQQLIREIDSRLWRLSAPASTIPTAPWSTSSTGSRRHSSCPTKRPDRGRRVKRHQRVDRLQNRFNISFVQMYFPCAGRYTFLMYLCIPSFNHIVHDVWSRPVAEQVQYIFFVQMYFPGAC